MEKMLARAKARLKEEDYRITRQREEILQKLIEQSGCHPTAEEIYESVKNSHPELGLATVYRTLRVLEDLDLVERLSVGKGPAKYEFSASNIPPHLHLVCVSCTKVQEVQCPHIVRMEEFVGSSWKFEISERSVIFFGLCDKCLQGKGSD